MINKEEMLNYIDKSIDSLKEDLRNYMDKSIEENRKTNKFYKKFKSDKVFENKEDLYNINSDEIELIRSTEITGNMVQTLEEIANNL